MADEVPAIYGLKYQARAIAAQAAEKEKTRFLVGTLSLKEENEIHLIEYLGDRNDLVCDKVYTHPAEVWEIAPSLYNHDLIFTIGNNAGTYEAKLFRMEGLEEPDESGSLTELCSLPGHSPTIRSVLWDAFDDSGRVASLDEDTIRLWSLGSDLSEPIATLKDPSTIGTCAKLIGGAWSPHHPNQLSTCAEATIRGWDLRNNKTSFVIDQAHIHGVRAVDYNPNKPYFLLSGGDDCKVKFWDYRKPDAPLKVLSSHSHWVWNVQYNYFHDQLVVSSSTDSIVNLWNVASLSSAPLGDIVEDEEKHQSASDDSLLRSFDEHEDSVYAVAWSCSEMDSWVFASLSYDGRVVVNHVPAKEKYKILL